MNVQQRLPGSGHFDVVVLGASAGGLQPMRTILRGLDAYFAAAVAVVLHRSPDVPSALGEILRRDADMAVEDATVDTRLRPGLIVIAPPDRHLVLGPGGSLELHEGVRHHLRSAVDPVLESAAHVYGSRSLAVVLSGGGNDGTEGARAVHAAGGVVVVQDPATAGTSAMPAAVVAVGVVDLSLPVERIAGALTLLVERGRESVLAGV